MRDVVLIATVFAFFALCVAYVRACDRIIGREPIAQVTEVASEEATPIADSAR